MEATANFSAGLRDGENLSPEGPVNNSPEAILAYAFGYYLGASQRSHLGELSEHIK